MTKKFKTALQLTLALSTILSVYVLIARDHTLLSSLAGALKWTIFAGFAAFEVFVIAYMLRFFFVREIDQSEAQLRRKIEFFFGKGRTAELFLIEARLWLYALRSKGRVNWQGRRFTYAAQGGNASNQKIFLWMAAFEIPVAHFILGFFLSDLWRYVIMFVSLYVLLWMYAELKATHMRMITVDEKYLHLRYGILTDLKIQRAHIAKAERISSIHHGQLDMKVAGLGQVSVAIYLDEAIDNFLKRKITSIGIGCDDAQGLVDVLNGSHAVEPC